MIDKCDVPFIQKIKFSIINHRNNLFEIDTTHIDLGLVKFYFNKVYKIGYWNDLSYMVISKC